MIIDLELYHLSLSELGLTVSPLRFGAHQDSRGLEPQAGDPDSGCHCCSFHQHRWDPHGDVPGANLLSPGTEREAAAGLSVSEWC